jgi:multiple sugar transport system substrate-binding protein
MRYFLLLLLAFAFLSFAPSVQPVRAQQPVTIQYWHIYAEGFGAPTVRELIRLFEQQHPEIKVEPRFSQNIYTGLLQNLQAALAAGPSANPADVAVIGHLYMRYVANNFPYVSITSLAKQYGGEDHLKRFGSNILALAQVNGEQVGMPYSLSTIVNYYNADILRKAGLDPDNPPQTWAEWRKAAPVIKAKTGKYGIYVQYLDDNWSTEAFIASNGGSLLTCGSDGTYRAVFDSPEAVEAIQFWSDVVNEGIALYALENVGEQSFLVGDTATYMTSIARRQTVQSKATFDVRGTKFPRFGNKPTRLPGGGNDLVIFSKDPAKQKAAWEFVRFLTSPEGVTLWTKGTGYVPLLPETTRDPRYLQQFIKENPIQQVAIDQLPNAIPWTSFPGSNGLAASQALFKSVQRAIGKQDTVERALKAGAAEVNQLLRGERCK